MHVPPGGERHAPHTHHRRRSAKSVFEVACSDRPGRIRARHRFTRAQFAHFVATTAPATVVMEACGTAHYWGRQAQAHYRVVLLPPHAVRPYVPRNKTTAATPPACRSAAQRGAPARAGEIVAQQALTALHRLRSTWLATRTARLNTVRGRCELRRHPRRRAPGPPRRPALLADPDLRAPRRRGRPCERPRRARRPLEERLPIEQQLSASPPSSPRSPPCAPFPASACSPPPPWSASSATRTASHRAPSRFPGLTPREHSSGTRRRLGAISKRGDAYLRMPSPTAPAPSSATPSAPRRGRTASAVGARPGAPPRPQPRPSRARQQARAHRLGRLTIDTLFAAQPPRPSTLTLTEA
ncbi:MAG: transposase [Candidatus Binatia bacterium]